MDLSQRSGDVSDFSAVLNELTVSRAHICAPAVDPGLGSETRHSEVFR